MMIQQLHIPKTRLTPEVKFNTDGVLTLKGVSTPENIRKFYEPVFNWLQLFCETNPQQVVCTFELEYLNTSSCRLLVELIQVLEVQKAKGGCSIRYIWSYDRADEDLLEVGEDLQLSAHVIFEFLSR
jgi:hypothetical protein